VWTAIPILFLTFCLLLLLTLFDDPSWRRALRIGGGISGFLVALPAGVILPLEGVPLVVVLGVLVAAACGDRIGAGFDRVRRARQSGGAGGG
jgi:hypothetical protein